MLVTACMLLARFILNGASRKLQKALKSLDDQSRNELAKIRPEVCFAASDRPTNHSLIFSLTNGITIYQLILSTKISQDLEEFTRQGMAPKKLPRNLNGAKEQCLFSNHKSSQTIQDMTEDLHEVKKTLQSFLLRFGDSTSLNLQGMSHRHLSLTPMTHMYDLF